MVVYYQHRWLCQTQCVLCVSYSVSFYMVIFLSVLVNFVTF